MSFIQQYNRLPTDVQNIINKDLDEHIYKNLHKPIQDSVLTELARENDIILMADFLQDHNNFTYPNPNNTKKYLWNLSTNKKHHFRRNKSTEYYLISLRCNYDELISMFGQVYANLLDILIRVSNTTVYPEGYIMDNLDDIVGNWDDEDSTEPEYTEDELDDDSMSSDDDM